MEQSASSEMETLVAMATSAFAEVGTLIGDNRAQWQGQRPTVDGFLLLADSLVAELSLWASMSPSVAHACPHIASFVASAYRIAFWGAAISDEVANAYFVENGAALRRLTATARRLTAGNYDPELLVPCAAGCDEARELRILKLRNGLAKALKVVARLLAQVARAAEMPRVPHPARVAAWTRGFADAVNAHLDLHATDYERDIAQMQALRGMARRQALEYLAKYNSDSLALLPLGDEAARVNADTLGDFVVKLRAASVMPVKVREKKGRKPNIGEMIALVAAHRWALRQLALLDSPATTTTIINNYNTENNMINNYNCSIGKQIVNDGSGTMNVYGDREERQLSENEQLLKTFFADDNFFEKTIATAPTCTTTDLVVTKIYRMLRIDAEMPDDMLRSKPFLEALIGVLPDNPAFTVANLQKAILRKQP